MGRFFITIFDSTFVKQVKTKARSKHFQRDKTTRPCMSTSSETFGDSAGEAGTSSSEGKPFVTPLPMGKEPKNSDVQTWSLLRITFIGVNPFIGPWH